MTEQERTERGLESSLDENLSLAEMEGLEGGKAENKEYNTVANCSTNNCQGGNCAANCSGEKAPETDPE